jgi:uncharacterized protein Usg
MDHAYLVYEDSVWIKYDKRDEFYHLTTFVDWEWDETVLGAINAKFLMLDEITRIFAASEGH